MSGIKLNKYWHLRPYRYTFYRWIVQKLCDEKLSSCSCFMLDAGCGDRGSSISFFHEGTIFIGVDVKRENLLKSKRIVKKGSFILASLTHLPFISTFDLVVCVDVLEHVTQKAKTLKEISRVCLPNGEFVASTTNIFNPLLFIDTYLPPKIAKILAALVSKKAHYDRHRRFSSLSFVSSLRENGFADIRMTMQGFPLFDPWLYNYSNKRIPFYAYIWILFDKITSKTSFRILKETMVVKALKENG